MLAQILLLRLIESDARRALLLFSGLGFFDFHGLVHPLVGGFNVSRSLFRHIAFAVRFFAIQQVDIRHGIVVVRTKLQRLVQIVETILNNRSVLLTQLSADFFVLQLHRKGNNA